MEICSSYRGAVMQHQSTAALSRAEKLPHCSVLLCKTGSQHDCVTAITPMEVCSSYCCYTKALQHWSRQHCFPIVQFCFAKQAHSICCHCSYTLGDLLFLQVCSDATPKQHWSGQNRFHTVQCCSAKKAHSMIVSLQLHLGAFALLTGVQ